MLIRLGMSMIFWIFAKLLRTRKLFWTVAGISSPGGAGRGKRNSKSRGIPAEAGTVQAKRSTVTKANAGTPDVLGGAGVAVGLRRRSSLRAKGLLDLDSGPRGGELILHLLGVGLVDA